MNPVLSKDIRIIISMHGKCSISSYTKDPSFRDQNLIDYQFVKPLERSLLITVITTRTHLPKNPKVHISSTLLPPKILANLPKQHCKSAPRLPNWQYTTNRTTSKHPHETYNHPTGEEALGEDIMGEEHGHWDQ